MSEFENRNKGFDVGGDSDIEIDRDVVIVESERAPHVRRSPLAALPLFLGVLLLLANVVAFLRVPSVFTQKTGNGAISTLLLLASVVICVVLIVYGLAMRRGDDTRDGRPGYFWLVGLPILLGLLAPLLTLWGLHVNKSAGERANPRLMPCIEVYEKAAAIAKDNPRFRMLETDRDEVRCRVNAALGR